jgi:hypothetical protein
MTPSTHVTIKKILAIGDGAGAELQYGPNPSKFMRLRLRNAFSELYAKEKCVVSKF